MLLLEVKELVEVTIDVQRVETGIIAKILVVYTLDSRVG